MLENVILNLKLLFWIIIIIYLKQMYVETVYIK